jgi:hypothetical protein
MIDRGPQTQSPKLTLILRQVEEGLSPISRLTLSTSTSVAYLSAVAEG